MDNIPELFIKIFRIRSSCNIPRQACTADPKRLYSRNSSSSSYFLRICQGYCSQACIKERKMQFTYRGHFCGINQVFPMVKKKDFMSSFCRTVN